MTVLRSSDEGLFSASLRDSRAGHRRSHTYLRRVRVKQRVGRIDKGRLKPKIGHNIGLQAPNQHPISMGTKWSIAHGACGG